MNDVAKEAGVSKNTVSLVFKNDSQIPRRTAARIRKVASRLGYQKNATVARLMATLRASGDPGARATIALLNAHHDKTAFRTHPTIPTYVAGCRRRASQLGYGVDEIWLHDPSLTGTSLNSILRARGIPGVVVVGLMKGNVLPPEFHDTWKNYPCVVTGVRTREPALSFACVDHHDLVRKAFDRVLECGYTRPALVLDRVIDELVDGRFSAGFEIAQRDRRPRNRLSGFYHVVEARSNPSLFRRWLERAKPDVILTLYREVRTWVEGFGLNVPGDLGLVQLEWRANDPTWAGMNQHNDITGEAAVEMLVAMIQNGESGVPEFPRATLISSSWVDGGTLLRSKKPHAR